MAWIWEPNPKYTFLRHYVDAVTRSCYRRLRVEGRDNIPTDGHVLLAPNHCCTLMDALVVLRLERIIGFGARADIFANPKTARILRFLRIVPLARERDGLAAVAGNASVFEEIVDCLGHNVPFCMFSEGRHRPERGMLPVQRGIFRIASLAVEKLDGPIYIVPVGLDYEDFFRTQRDLTIRIGEPMEMRSRLEGVDGAALREEYEALSIELRERVLVLLKRTDAPSDARQSLAVRILKVIAAVLLLPLLAVLAVCALPIWLPYRILDSRMRDKAWSQTVRYGLRLALPIFWPFDILLSGITNFIRGIFR